MKMIIEGEEGGVMIKERSKGGEQVVGVGTSKGGKSG